MKSKKRKIKIYIENPKRKNSLKKGLIKTVKKGNFQTNASDC